MARLHANENFPQPVVHELRRWGHDILTVLETGKAEQSLPDQEVLAFARSEGRAVLTLNRKHFIRLHQQAPDHAGIICCAIDPDFIGQAERIHTALSRHPELRGQPVRVNRPAADSPASKQ